MLKKVILTVGLSLALAGGIMAAPAGVPAANEPASPEMITAENPVVSEVADGQAYVETTAPNSTEVNAVEESETTRKMLQAEKARNVKENDSWGGALTIMSMCIVLFALIVLCLLFNVFGKISSRFMSKKKLSAHGISPEAVDNHDDHLDSGETIAAIAMALAEHFDSKHDIEDTVLTIRRMKRAYSPWNSKIYGMRQVPELQKNTRR